jgi:hypothetical protein
LQYISIIKEIKPDQGDLMKKLILMAAIITAVVSAESVKEFNQKNLTYHYHNNVWNKIFTKPISLLLRKSTDDYELTFNGPTPLAIVDDDFDGLCSLFVKAIKWDSIANANNITSISKSLGDLEVDEKYFKILSEWHFTNSNISVIFGRNGPISIILLYGELQSSSNQFLSSDLDNINLDIKQIKALLDNLTPEKLISYRNYIVSLRGANDNLFN